MGNLASSHSIFLMMEESQSFEDFAIVHTHGDVNFLVYVVH